MFERFTPPARSIVVLAQEESRAMRHPYIGTEHLLLGMMREREGVAAQALAQAGITAPRVVDQILARVPMAVSTPEGHIPFDAAAKAALEQSLTVALEMGNDWIDTGHVLLGVLRVPQSFGCFVLHTLGADPGALYDFMAPRMRQPSGRAAPEPGVPGTTGEVTGRCALCGASATTRHAMVTVDGSASICDACLRAGVEALDADDGSATVAPIGQASPEARDLVEPGRTLWVAVLDGVARRAPGVKFEDVEAARKLIADALASMFVLSGDGRALPSVIGGENLGLSLREAQAKHPYFARQPAVATSIEFTSESSARVAFALGNPEEGVKWVGEVNKVGDAWMVSRATAVEVLQQAGVICPPPGT